MSESYYRSRKKAGLCIVAGCKRRPKKGVRCKPCAAEAQERDEKRRRDTGMRPLADYNRARHEAAELRRARRKDADFSEARFAGQPSCPRGCGLRHAECDMEQRRTEIATAGLGSWA